MYLFSVQAAAAHQFTGEQQHRNFVTIARFRDALAVDVEYIDPEWLRFGQCGEFAQHLLAEAAPGPGVQDEARRRRLHPSAVA
jgi:hypothetical protein